MATARILRVAVPLLKRSNLPNFGLPSRSRHAAATYVQTLQNIPETRITTLDNGFRIATEDNGSQSCTVGLWTDVGSRYENDSTNGVCNFLEHMLFKGTSKRSQAALETEVEKLGAHLNGYTSRERTALYAKCLSKDLPKAVDILSDVIQNSKFDEQEVEKTRGVILKELEEEIGSDLGAMTFDHLHSMAYQGTPLGNSVFGPTENIKSIQRQDLVKFSSTHFKPPRMVLAAAGGVDHDQLVKLAEQHFGSMKITYDGEIPLLKPCRFTGSDIRVRDDDLPLAHIAIAVQGCGLSDPATIPLMIASTLIGNWDKTYGGGNNVSSVLAAKCTAGDLCESFQSFNISYTDTGLWGIYFVGDTLMIDDMLYNFQTEWMKLCWEVTDGEIVRAKNQLKTKLLLQLDGSTPTCDDIGRQVLSFGRRISFQEIEAQIDAVDAKQLQNVCQNFIYDRCPAVAAVGPVEGLYDYTRIRAGMYWLRT